MTIAIDKMDGHALSNKVYHKRLPKKAKVTCSFAHSFHGRAIYPLNISNNTSTSIMKVST